MYSYLSGLLLTVMMSPVAVYGSESFLSQEADASVNIAAIQAQTYGPVSFEVPVEEIEEVIETVVEPYEEINTTYITTAPLNLRPSPSTSGTRIILVQAGRRVEVVDFRDGEWFFVDVNGQRGYMYARYLRELPAPGQHAAQAGSVELIQWSEARNIIPKNTPLTIIDVRTQSSFQVISFSHGSHADVFAVTAEDTAIIHSLFGRWQWTTRPILVLVGDRTFAASINGMPHGGGARNGNNMNGHLCIHFQGSRTHNGSVNHERDHQRSVMEAFNTASGW